MHTMSTSKEAKQFVVDPLSKDEYMDALRRIALRGKKPSNKLKVQTIKSNISLEKQIDLLETRFDELDLYRQQFSNLDDILKLKTHCTSCCSHLSTAPDEEKRICTHPLLLITQCSTCNDFYTSGEFERGEDGSELYCRWCGQGGEVYCCADCIFVFCKACIKRNFPKECIRDVLKNENWKCFACDPEYTTVLRARHWAILKYVERQRNEINKKQLEAQNCANSIPLSRRTRCLSENTIISIKKEKNVNSESLPVENNLHNEPVTTNDILLNVPPVSFIATPTVSQPTVLQPIAAKRPSVTLALRTSYQPTAIHQSTALYQSNAVHQPPVIHRPPVEHQPSAVHQSSPVHQPPAIYHPPVMHQAPVTQQPPAIRQSSVIHQSPGVYHPPGVQQSHGPHQQQNVHPPSVIQQRNMAPIWYPPSTVTYGNNLGPPTYRMSFYPRTVMSPTRLPPQQMQHTQNEMGHINEAPLNTQVRLPNGHIFDLNRLITRNNNGPRGQILQNNTMLQSMLLARHPPPPLISGTPPRENTPPVQIPQPETLLDQPTTMARTRLDLHLNNAMEVCQHITHKMRKFPTSQAYQQSRSTADIIQLNLHLAYLLDYTVERFQSLQKKCVEDSKHLTKSLMTSEDEVEIIEPERPVIDVDAYDEEPVFKRNALTIKRQLDSPLTITGPNKRIPPSSHESQ